MVHKQGSSFCLPYHVGQVENIRNIEFTLPSKEDAIVVRDELDVIISKYCYGAVERHGQHFTVSRDYHVHRFAYNLFWEADPGVLYVAWCIDDIRFEIDTTVVPPNYVIGFPAAERERLRAGIDDMRRSSRTRRQCRLKALQWCAIFLSACVVVVVVAINAA